MCLSRASLCCSKSRGDKRSPRARRLGKVLGSHRAIRAGGFVVFRPARPGVGLWRLRRVFGHSVCAERAQAWSRGVDRIAAGDGRRVRWMGFAAERRSRLGQTGSAFTSHYRIPIQREERAMLERTLTLVVLGIPGLAFCQSAPIAWVRAGHSGGVNCVAASPDGSLLASASDDRTLKVWRSGDGGYVRTFTIPYDIDDQTLGVKGAAFSPDGSMLAAAFGEYNAHQQREFG